MSIIHKTLRCTYEKGVNPNPRQTDPHALHRCGGFSLSKYHIPLYAERLLKFPARGKEQRSDNTTPSDGAALARTSED